MCKKNCFRNYTGCEQMKYNVFVPHTQYNLIISLAMVNGPYKEDQNDLILFTDFAISDSMKCLLKKQFNRVKYCSGTFPKENKRWKNKIKTIPKTINDLKDFLTNRYDRLLVVCDTAIPELWIIKHLKNKNPKLNIQWIEDGAWPYFTNDATQTGFNKNSFSRSIRFIIGKLIFGKYYNFKGTDIGSNNWIEEYLLTYPEAVREGFGTGKRKIEIPDKDFQMGMQLLYPETKYELPNKAVVVVFDKIDVYKDKSAVFGVLEKIFVKCNEEKIPVYYKCHPREEEVIHITASVSEIDRNLGIEGVYSSNMKKDICFIGVKSTGLQTAKKCGFEAVSLAPMLKETNSETVQFYNKIGVHQIKNKNEFDEFIKKLEETNYDY